MLRPHSPGGPGPTQVPSRSATSTAALASPTAWRPRLGDLVISAEFTKKSTEFHEQKLGDKDFLEFLRQEFNHQKKVGDTDLTQKQSKMLDFSNRILDLIQRNGGLKRSSPTKLGGQTCSKQESIDLGLSLWHFYQFFGARSSLTQVFLCRVWIRGASNYIRLRLIAARHFPCGHAIKLLLCHSFGCFLILLVHYEFILGIYPPA